jgi:hypothetical protein
MQSFEINWVPQVSGNTSGWPWRERWWCDRCCCKPCVCHPNPYPTAPLWPYAMPVVLPKWSPPQDVLKDAIAALVAAGVTAKDIEIVIRGQEAIVRIREPKP